MYFHFHWTFWISLTNTTKIIKFNYYYPPLGSVLNSLKIQNNTFMSKGTPRKSISLNDISAKIHVLGHTHTLFTILVKKKILENLSLPYGWKEYMCKVSTIYLYYYKSYYKLQETSEVLFYNKQYEFSPS